MYVPKQFRQEDRAEILEWMRSIQLGAVVIFSEGKFRSSHIPLLVSEEKGKLVLEGHVAKANELWKHAHKKNPALVIFQGPNTYIHPGWYASKKKDGKVVPTWTYLVIHCHGSSEAIESSEWLLKHVEKLTQNNEAKREHPWKISDAPPEFIESQLKSIVGIKIAIDELEGVWKMNQHHSEENRSSVLAGLSSSSCPRDLEVAPVFKQSKKDK